MVHTINSSTLGVFPGVFDSHQNGHKHGSNDVSCLKWKMVEAWVGEVASFLEHSPP